MHKVSTAQINRRTINRCAHETDSPINTALPCIVKDGDKKSLDYLECSANMTKGILAANGYIKLRPDIGPIRPIASDNPIKTSQYKEPEIDEEFYNEWDNIFLRNDNM